MTNAAWTLAAFEDRLDAWIAQDEPDAELRALVTAWILSRFEDPYDGVVREPGFPNLWYGAIPGSLHQTEYVVVCAYWIYEGTRTVVCESFASLSLPV